MSETNVKPSERINEILHEGYSFYEAIKIYLDEQHERAIKPPCTHCLIESKHPDCKHIASIDNGKNYCHLCSSYLSWEEVEEVKKRAVAQKINTSTCMVCYAIGTDEEIKNHKCAGVGGRFLANDKKLEPVSVAQSDKHVENVSGEISEVEELGKDIDSFKYTEKGVSLQEWLHCLGYSKRPAKDVKQDLSKCCNSPVKAVGGVTMHYECVKCGNACDIGGLERKELVELDENAIEKKLYEAKQAFGSELSYKTIAFIIAGNFGVPKKLSVKELTELIIKLPNDSGGWIKQLHQRIYGSKEG